MGIKTPAVFYRQSGEEWEKEAVYKGIESLMTYHGQAHGMFSGDEWLSGTHPSQGVELCAVVEYMFSMEQLVKIFGDGMFADILDKIAFNALPATISPDWDSHQYDQQANQIMCNVANRPWSNGPDANTFGLAPHFGCCTANMHQGWPKFAGSLWMGTRDNGLAAISYAPCHVQTKVADTEIELHVDSAYPFRENVTITITVSKEVQLPILLRVPRWCPDMKIKVNGQQQTYTIENGFARIERQWQDQDQIELDLPMEVNVTERNNYAASIERGPLVYALPLGEQWVQTHERERFHDWEIYPKSNWRYGLVTDGEFRLSKGEIAYQPFKADNPPVKLQVNGKIVSNWGMENNSAAEPPINPKTHPDAKTETLELIPYGSARLRITEFPVLEE